MVEPPADDKNMGNTFVYLLWLVAGGVLLAAFVARRRKRKASEQTTASIKH
jgi:hypothetical protein